MNDYSSLQPDEFYGLCEVLADLYQRIDAGDVMIVGAAARDLIHRDFGFDFKLRSTTDIDVAVILAESDAYKELTDAYVPTGNSGIRFIIADQKVDIVPFGRIENPPGTSYPPPGNHGIDVYGFSAVYNSAVDYVLPGGVIAKVPSPAGYCMTKIKAWVDRSPNNELKDAADMPYVCYWYQNSPEIFESLFSSHADLLAEADFDVDLASMYLLGSEVRSLLGPQLSTSLAEMWDETSRGRMSRVERFDSTLGNNDNRNPEHRLRSYNAIHSRL